MGLIKHSWLTVWLVLLLFGTKRLGCWLHVNVDPQIDRQHSTRQFDFLDGREQRQEQDSTYSQKTDGNSIRRKIVNIGLVLSPENNNLSKMDRLEVLMRDQLDRINRQQEQQDDGASTQIEIISTNIVPNPIEMSKIICDQLIGNQNGGVSAVIVDTNSKYIASIATISFTLSLYNIPMIGTTLRDSSLFNKNLHSSYISLIPPNSHQADVWLDLMLKLQFKQAFVLTSSENRDILSRFVDLVDHRQNSIDFKIEAIIEFDSAAYPNRTLAFQTITTRLTTLLENSICRVVLVHAQSKSDVQFFLALMQHLNMFRGGFALILSEDMIQVAKENNFPLSSGIISSQLSFSGEKQADSSIAYAMDALDIVARSIFELNFDQADHDSDDSNHNQLHRHFHRHSNAFRNVPNSCQLSPSNVWQTGIELQLAIRRQTFLGQTGYVLFDENGDRLAANHDLLNLVELEEANASASGIHQTEKELLSSSAGANRKLMFKLIGTFRNGLQHELLADQLEQGDEDSLDISSIQWPGGISGQLISGVFVNKHLRIVTLQEKPFVWVLADRSCWLSSGESGNVSTTSSQLALPCRKDDPTKSDGYEKFCCIGYCMELLNEIARQLNFTFELYLAPDNEFGQLESEQVLAGDDSLVGRDKISSSSPAAAVAQQQQLRQGQASNGSLRLAPVGSDNVASGLPAMTAEGYANHVGALVMALNGSQLLEPAGVGRAEVGATNGKRLAGSRAEMGRQLKWSGLMGELVGRRADMAFAPLTITAQRAQAIDFSKPFKFHGFSLLLRRASKHTTLASFLQPFHNQLWILVIGVATHVVALTLYLLDRYSTFGRFGIKRRFLPKSARNTHDDYPLHLSSSLWFSWSILLNSGVGEHTPKSLSGRVLGIFWSGFAMIVVASYTANLAAFLVLDSREETPTLSGIDDPRLRSGDLNYNFATVKGSAVDAYLQSQVEYINLYRKMEELNFNHVDESILALRSGTIDGLIWDSSRLEWEVATDEKCSLGIAGELFGSSGYGIGLQKDSYWTKNITTKLLELHESGYMIDLDKKWISSGRANQQQHCERRNEDYPETLGIFNIAGVFILFACGLVTSFGLIQVERFCFKRRANLVEFRRRWMSSIIKLGMGKSGSRQQT